MCGPKICCLPVALVLVLWSAGPGRAGETEAIRLLDAVTKNITSYDVWLTADYEWFVQYDEVEVENEYLGYYKRTKSIPRAYRPNEPRRRARHIFHQTFERGKLRIDHFEADGKTLHSTSVCDGETVRALNGAGSEGKVDDRPVSNAEEGCDYMTFFRGIHGNWLATQMFRERQTTSARKEQADGGEFFVVSCQPELSNRNTSAGQWGFRMALDPRHGMMPQRLERFVLLNSKELVERRTLIGEFFKLESGVWVPTKAVTSFYQRSEGSFHRALVLTVTSSIDKTRSRWNQPVPAERFTLKFPTGARVSDFTRGTQFVTGTKDTGENLRALAEDSRPILQLAGRSPAPPQADPVSVWRWITLLLLTLLIACVVALLIAGYRRRRAA